MPISNILKSAAGTCPFCHQKAGILTRQHPECQRTFQAGWNKMVAIAETARIHVFDEKTLRLTLAETAGRSYGDGATVNKTLEEGWKQGMAHAIADGIISPHEEDRLKKFDNQMAPTAVPRIQAFQYGPHEPWRGFAFSPSREQH